jgi:hypothetical protein
MISERSNPGDYGNVPSLGIVQNDIANAQWAAPLVAAPQGTDPWGTIPGISPDAQFIWHDTFAQTTSSFDHYVIFRTELPEQGNAVPEPGTFMLLGSGILGLLVPGARRFFSRA